MPFSKTQWTEEKIRILSENFKCMPDAELAEMIGATEKAVYNKLRAEGLLRIEQDFSKEELGIIFRNVLTKRFRRYPYGLFDGEKGQERLRAVLEFAVIEHLGISVEDVPRKLTAQQLEDLRLAGPLRNRCGTSPYGVAELIWPGRFRPWEFLNGPQGMWSGKDGRENARAALRWLFEEKLGLAVDQIPKQSLYELLSEHGLMGLVQAYGGSIFDAVLDAYPNAFTRRDFRYALKWSTNDGQEEAKRLVKEMLEKVRTESPDRFPRNVNQALFKNNGLATILLIFSREIERITVATLHA